MDLMTSYVKASEVSPPDARSMLEKALQMGVKLRNERKLLPIDDWKIDDLKRRLAALDAAPTGSGRGEKRRVRRK